MYTKSKIIILTAVTAAIGLGFLLGSQRQGQSLVTVRTYTVPTDRTDEIKAQLNSLMSGAHDGERRHERREVLEADRPFVQRPAHAAENGTPGPTYVDSQRVLDNFDKKNANPLIPVGLK